MAQALHAMQREIDLLYSFEGPNFFYPKCSHLYMTIVEGPRHLFKNPWISITNLSKLYLDPDHTQHLVDEYMDMFTYTDEEVYALLELHVTDEYPRVFDTYYDNKYGMSRQEIKERIKVQSESEKEVDDAYEIEWLLYTRKDALAHFVYQRDKKKLSDPDDVFRWDLTSLIGNTIIGGMISRLVHEYVYPKNNKSTVDKVKQELIEYKEWLLDQSFVMSDRVTVLWKEYI